MRGTSGRDTRKVFSTILRHTRYGKIDADEGEEGPEIPWNRNPATDILIPRRLNVPSNSIDYNGVVLKTDTYDIDLDSQDHEKLLEQYKRIREFWSPYNIMEFEDLSWNLNRHKVLPYGIRAASMQNQFTLMNPKGSGLGAAGFEGSAASGFSFLKAKEDPANANAVLLNDTLLSDKLAVVPVLGDLEHNYADYQSNMRKTCVHFNALTTDANNEYLPNNTGIGKYVAQISNGVCYYTFNNTGDSKMLVDIVVHKIKDGFGFGESTKSQNNDIIDKFRITDRIISQYSSGWIERRTRNKGDYYLYEADNKNWDPLDIVYNPKVKFMPTSCRTLKYPADDVNVAKNDVVSYGSSHDGDATYRMQTRYGALNVQTPPFVEIKRDQIVVLPGKRKTFALRLPARSYDPTKMVYSAGSVLNELGYHVLFGVTGQRTRTVVAGREGPAHVNEGPRVVGIDHAPTSFKLIGRYYESVLPAVCIDPDNSTEQGLDLDIDAPLDDIGDESEDRMFSAQFNDVSARDVDGRYVKVGIDGKVTQARKFQKTEAATEFTEHVDENFEANVDETTVVVSPEKTKTDQQSAGVLTTINNAGKTMVTSMNDAFTSFGALFVPNGTPAEKRENGMARFGQITHYVTKYAGWLGVDFMARGGATIQEIGKFAVEMLGRDEHTVLGEMSAAIGGLAIANSLYTNLQIIANWYKASQEGDYSTLEQHMISEGYDADTINAITNIQLGLERQNPNTEVQGRRLHADGTQIVYVDHDNQTADIQGPAPLDVNVTNTEVPVTSTDGKQFMFTSEGMSKLEAQKGSALDESASYTLSMIAQQMVTYAENHSLTGAGVDDDGHLFMLRIATHNDWSNTFDTVNADTNVSQGLMPLSRIGLFDWLPAHVNALYLIRGVDWTTAQGIGNTLNGGSEPFEPAPTDWVFNGSSYYRSQGPLSYTPSGWESYHSGANPPGAPRAFSTVYVRDEHPTNQQDPRNLTGGYTVYGPPEHGFVRTSNGFNYIRYSLLPNIMNPPYPM